MVDLQRIRERRFLRYSDKLFSEAAPMVNRVYKDPKGIAEHFNIFIKDTSPRQSAGSIGKYEFCIDVNTTTPRAISF
jgi:hypothetical protein